MHEVAIEVRGISSEWLVRIFFSTVSTGPGSCVICLCLFREARTDGEALSLVELVLCASQCQLRLHAWRILVWSCMQGKIHKSIRKPVAGICLLLAAKFILDLKKQEISDLISVS